MFSTRRSAAVTCTIAIVLPAHVVAQESIEVKVLVEAPQEVKVVLPAPQAATAPRFDVGPTLWALMKATGDVPAPERPVAHGAWVALAFVANGSTLRIGTYRAAVRMETKCLVERQDPGAGRFLAGTAPCSSGEQLFGALALTEAWVNSGPYRPYQKAAELSITATAALTAAKAPSPTVDEFVGAMLLARCTAAAKCDAAAVEEIGKVLVHARSAMKAGKVRRTDAALHLDELLQGKAHPPEFTVAATWPANPTADPLHTLIAALAVSVSPMHEKARAAQFETLAKLVAARETEGEQAGTWAPAGGLDRLTTTAMHAITLALANGKTPLFCVK